MAQLIVRNVPPEVVRGLKVRAAALGRSAEAEHRELPGLNRACAVLCLLLSCAAPEPGPPPEDGGAGTVCDHASCSGCCQNGVCYSGYENATCGLLGHQCVACPEWYPCSKTRRCAPPDVTSAPSQQGTGGAVADAKIGPIDPDGGDAGDAGVPPQQEKPTCYYVGWVMTCP